MSTRSAIRALIESGLVSHARADVVTKDLHPARLSLPVSSRYRLRAQTSSLLPFRRGRAPRSRLPDPEVEGFKAIICTVVEGIHLPPEEARQLFNHRSLLRIFLKIAHRSKIESVKGEAESFYPVTFRIRTHGSLSEVP
jgi:hypothetical protein